MPADDPRATTASERLSALLARCETLYRDLDLAAVRAWRAAHPGRAVIGHLPVYAPREIVHAAGMLPVGVTGAGDQLEIVRGDAFFQSYICHLPRSVVELGLSGRLEALDGMLFPSTCDVIRNLSGMWQVLFPDKYVFYLDVPQNFDPEVGGRYWAGELRRLRRDLESLGGRRIADDDLHRSIALYDENRRLLRELGALRHESPWRAPASEAHLVVRAGLLLPVEEHSALVRDYLDLVRQVDRPERDNSRVVLRGAFCEQPPLALLRTLERAGCDLVDDDLLLGSRFLEAGAAAPGDPIDALALAFLRHGAACAVVYTGSRVKGADLVDTVRRSGAEGVLLAAASFCDPALLDQPMLVAALDRAGIPHTSFKYAEDTGQFQVIREQAGTFSDSIKLWSEP
jgi:benzoyl-CoA reductase subunit C